MGPVQLPMHSEKREMHAGFPICWLYTASVVHRFSSELRVHIVLWDQGSNQHGWVNTRILQSEYSYILPPFLTCIHPHVHAHFWDTLQSWDTPKYYTCQMLEPKCNLQQLSTFSIVSKVHGGCVREQWVQGSWVHRSPVACAGTELQLYTVRTIDLMDFVFWQQIERAFSCRSPKAGRSGQWGTVLLQLFLFA